MNNVSERQQLEELRQQLRNLETRLGITPKRDRNEKSPDGGAIVVNNPIGSRSVPTMRVRLLTVEGNDEAHIRACDFDPTKHEALEPSRRRREIDKPQPKAKTEIETTNLTRSALSVMTVAALKQQPEILTGFKEGEVVPEKKSELLAAIERFRRIAHGEE